MFLDTLWVNRKLKLTWPRAGLEIPSIFCSTHGPRSTLGVVVWGRAEAVCQGQPNLTLGRWTSTPTRCSAADRAARTSHAMALRKIRPATIAAAHLAHRGIRRGRRGGGAAGRGRRAGGQPSEPG